VSQRSADICKKYLYCNFLERVKECLAFWNIDV
jgi:hypothetical protein